MKRTIPIFAALFAIGIASAGAEDPKPKPATPPLKGLSLDLSGFKFSGGPPTATRNLATRNSKGEPIVVTNIVPATKGNTAVAQPSFFWHQTHPASDNLAFILFETASKKPVVRYRIPGKRSAGLQRLDLASLGKSIEPGKNYTWSITYIIDPKDQSGNPVATGQVELTPLPDAATLPPAERIQKYQDNGIWYDLLALLDDALAADPSNAGVAAARDSLIKQAELGDILPLPATPAESASL